MEEEYSTNYKRLKAWYGEQTLQGWKNIIHPLIDLCEKNEVAIHQIKEKFGTLRFYTGSAPENVHLAVSEGERASESMCEICGEPGQLNTLNCCNQCSPPKHWLKTRCEKHWSE